MRPLSLCRQTGGRRQSIEDGRLSIVGEELERGTLKRLFDVSIPSPTSYWFVSPMQHGRSKP